MRNKIQEYFRKEIFLEPEPFYQHGCFLTKNWKNSPSERVSFLEKIIWGIKKVENLRVITKV
jgi:hypothetical protein